MAQTYAHGEELRPATQPTMYFIGVTTGQSSIRPVFKEWARILDRSEVQLVGIDLPLHADPSEYRRVTRFIKEDPQSLGALVTTHKVQLYRACQDLFDDVDPDALVLHEVSCLAKRGSAFRASAKDPITSAHALESFLPTGYWSGDGHEVVCLGAGGSALALASHFVRVSTAMPAPERLVVTNRSAGRLNDFRIAYESIGSGPALELVHAVSPAINDAVVSGASAGALVINATGLGKDAPGSPVTWEAVFPERGIAWDFNYRGDLLFLEQARAQAGTRSLTVEDGWVYFLHGWTQVIAEVLNVPIPPRGPLFDELASAAMAVRLAT